jgi:hypothetical protein
LFGVKFSLSTTSAYAAPTSSYCFTLRLEQKDCIRPASNCLCTIYVNG